MTDASSHRSSDKNAHFSLKIRGIQRAFMLESQIEKLRKVAESKDDEEIIDEELIHKLVTDHTKRLTKLFRVESPDLESDDDAERDDGIRAQTTQTDEEEEERWETCGETTQERVEDEGDETHSAYCP